MKRINICLFSFAILAACAPTGEDAGEAGNNSVVEVGSWAKALGTEITEPFAAPEHRAFDFWIGEWEANWRARPEGEFYHQEEGSWTRQRVFPVLGGKALIELGWARDNPEEPSQRGFSIRYFDAAREHWVMAQNWPNAQNQGLAFTDQLIGKDHFGRLSMYSVSERPQPDGTLLSQHRRYNFTDVRPGESFRWDGSNTPDEGATWFTWYVVDFLRERDLDPFAQAGTDFPGVHEKALCTNGPHGAMNGLAGVWEGVREDASGATTPAQLSAGLVLDGCGILAALETQDARELLAAGFVEQFAKWVIYRLDDQPGKRHAYYVSDDAGEGAVFAEAKDLAIKDEFTPYLRTASFNTEGSVRRLGFDTLSDDALVLREETRNSDGEWVLAARYRLGRQ